MTADNSIINMLMVFATILTVFLCSVNFRYAVVATIEKFDWKV